MSGLKELARKIFPREGLQKPESDFSTGAFWQTPLGEKVKEFMIKQAAKKFPKQAFQIPDILGFKYTTSSEHILELIECGILANVKKPAGRSDDYHLQLRDVVICGLALLHLERGYPLTETSKNLSQLLEGTALRSSLGSVDEAYSGNLREGRNFFSAASPWREFPLEPKIGKERLVPVKKPMVSPKTVTDAPSGEVLKTLQPQSIADVEFLTDRQPRRKWVSQKVPSIDIKELGDFRSRGREEIQRLLAITPDNLEFDTFNFTRVRIPPALVELVVFVMLARKKRLRNFDDLVEAVNFRDFRYALQCCLDCMDEHPEIKNLEQLYEFKRGEVKKNPELFWYSE